MMGPDFLDAYIEEVMTRNPKTLDRNVLLSELLHIMEEHKITNMFVINEDDEPIGIVHMHDLVSHKIV
jgi:arabinose-5-phosphate isomerase